MSLGLVYMVYLLEKHPEAVVKLVKKALELLSKSEFERLAEELEPARGWAV